MSNLGNTGTGKGGWATALAEVDRAVGDCLAALDRYEGAFADILSEVGPVLGVHRALVPPEGDWGERTAAARAKVADVEQLLDEQEQAWTAWQESFTAWRRSLEQLPR